MGGLNTGRPWLVVSVHDVAPASFASSLGWVGELDRMGVAATLLVIPGPWRGETLRPGTAFAAWLRAARASGHEVAQHGWSHEAVSGHGPIFRRAAGRVLARGCEEFWSLTFAEASARLVRGRSALEYAGFGVEGFTPPGWLASLDAMEAMAASGFRYTTTHTAVIDLVAGRRHNALALCHRPGGRLEAVGARLMNTAARRLPPLGRGLRIALHPDEFLRPHLRRASLEAIAAALSAGARPVTYLDVVGSAAMDEPEAA